MSSSHSIVVEFDLKEHSFKELPIEQFTLDSDEHKIYWIHCDLNQPGIFPQLLEKLQLPADVKKLSSPRTLSTVIERDKTLSLKVECLLSNSMSHHNAVKLGSLILHLSSKFCFTASSKALPALLDFKQSYPKSLDYAKTPCFILFLILDSIVNEYAKITFDFELLADEIDCEEASSTKHDYHRVMDMKQKVIKTKRHLLLIREILLRISGRNSAVISAECKASLANLANHSNIIVSESDAIRDILNSLLDQIDNMLMQRMNETMRILTAFSAIFLPLSLITGIYGMNFHWMPELAWKYGYFIILAVIIGCLVGLIYLFKRKNWF
jgi:magnesium transporter